MSQWITFEDGSQACLNNRFPSLEAALEKATELAGKKAVKTASLPYPANPQLNKEDSGCPPFCYTPRECAGHSSCPKSYACSE